MSNLPWNISLLENDKIRKTSRSTMRETVIFMEKLCKFLIGNPDPTIVTIYDFADYGWQKDGTYLYTYDMEKLWHLSRNEKKIIQVVADDWYEMGILPHESNCELVRAAEKDYPKLYIFLDKLTKLDRYTDLNTGNVMLDQFGEYRTVDLEGFYHAPLNHYKNLWFQ